MIISMMITPIVMIWHIQVYMIMQLKCGYFSHQPNLVVPAALKRNFQSLVTISLVSSKVRCWIWFRWVNPRRKCPCFEDVPSVPGKSISQYQDSLRLQHIQLTNSPRMQVSCGSSSYHAWQTNWDHLRSYRYNLCIFMYIFMYCSFVFQYPKKIHFSDCICICDHLICLFPLVG